ncbi:right-handed parallel beta-helix repeat-containing protein, partial [bacterium]|nr:right-handed parallel beta-helix repeat-containing protein [bacterium]
AESGGDGIYLGVSQRGVTNKNILIQDVVCDANHRQGISVISAEDLLIENTIMRNTSGTAPQAGIDFEPNHAGEKLVRCVMRNCLTENNAGDGYLFALHHMTGASEPVSVRLENCRAVRDHRKALRWHACGSHPDGPTRGSAEFVGCTFERSADAGISLSNVIASTFAVRIADCKILDVAAKMPDTAPIAFGSRPGNRLAFGNVALEDCHVRDSLDRQPIAWGGWTSGLDTKTLRGALTVERDGNVTRYTLDRETLSRWIPWTAVQDIPTIALSDLKLEPLRPKATYVVPNWRLRGQSEYLLFTTAGEEITFAVRARSVGGAKAKVALTLVAPSGKATTLPRPPADKDRLYRMPAAEAGAWRLVADSGRSTVTVGSTTHRMCIVAGTPPLHGFGARGAFHFLVPAGVERFGIKLGGSGSGERLKATVCAPHGNAVQTKDSIASMHAFTVRRADASKGAVWSLRIEKPSKGVLEDWYLELVGVPPLLAPTPAALLKPVKR